MGPWVNQVYHAKYDTTNFVLRNKCGNLSKPVNNLINYSGPLYSSNIICLPLPKQRSSNLSSKYCQP